ncbi:hypothetical protein EVAR_8427_1 [Eumeta japonica]|uniref:Uncharacterized protein n=1 Tax=Eumeta variegata TaxID=151549 RepID=A0A4C1WEG2_EUMVA|nr:hypothetical protein EVAR_8427_1 [Eumeta japonica]
MGLQRTDEFSGVAVFMGGDNHLLSGGSQARLLVETGIKNPEKPSVHLMGGRRTPRHAVHGCYSRTFLPAAVMGSTSCNLPIATSTCGFCEL